MKIQPFTDQVYIKIEKPVVGVLQTTKDSAVECAEVLEVPEHDCVTMMQSSNPQKCVAFKLHKGDKIFVKAWAIDTINYEDKVYNFVNISSGGIMAVIK